MSFVTPLEKYLSGCGLEPGLIHLVKLRASQINGCAFCIDMHTRDARAAGEAERRLYLLDAWREAPLYTPRERAALAWTEAVTRVANGHVPDAVFEEARAQFSDKELADLTPAVAAINAWNRLAISFRATPAGAGTATGPTLEGHEEAKGPAAARGRNPASEIHS
jgi:AhpD family alkylhydroperoxidase